MASTTSTKESSSGLDGMSDEILEIIVTYLVGKNSISSWPWNLHSSVGSGELVDHVGTSDLLPETWHNYYSLSSLNNRWRKSTEKVVEEMRKESFKGLLDSTWELFDLIYQPQGYSLPEHFGGSYRPWTNIAGFKLPPQGLVFVKKTCRSNACWDVFYKFGHPCRTKHMKNSALWVVRVPPRSLNGTGLMRICNGFIDEDPVLVGKPVGTNDFCLKKWGTDGPHVMLEDANIEVPAHKVELSRCAQGRRPLILVTRVGEDRCATFLQKFLPSTEETNV